MIIFIFILFIHILMTAVKGTTSKGKVYLASMNLRGAHAIAPSGTIKVNVTSAQVTANKNRRDFSPMTFLEETYEGFGNFEAWWQSLKRFEDIPAEKVKAFWKKVNESTGPKRRYPGSKGKRVLYAEWQGEQFDYISSRKKLYCPRYLEMVKNREMMVHWKEQVALGKDIVIYDFDGPRDTEGNVMCVEVTAELLQEKINDGRFPFGHGYVIAAHLLDIDQETFIF
jgi:hypothetical protein